MERTCSVDGCDRKVVARGWCNGHWKRWRKTGDPGSSPIEQRSPGAACKVDDCDRLVINGKSQGGRGWCGKHYQRWLKTGSPTTPVPSSNNWRGDEVGYFGVHLRLRNTLGPAKDRACAHCGGTAKDWAYDGTCPNEKTWMRQGAPLAYSTDPTRYLPLCRDCHSRYDQNTPQSRGSHNDEAAAL